VVLRRKKRVAGDQAKLRFDIHGKLLDRQIPWITPTRKRLPFAEQGADTRLIQDYVGTATFSTPSSTLRAIRRGFRGSGNQVAV
jgi:hypothetical protein